MDPEELTALWSWITVATAVSLSATKALAQDRLDAEVSRNLVITDLNAAKNIIS